MPVRAVLLGVHDRLGRQARYVCRSCARPATDLALQAPSRRRGSRVATACACAQGVDELAVGYSAVPFRGSLRDGESASVVAAQLEALLNRADGAAHGGIVRLFGSVSIQFQPGCLGRLLGAEQALQRYDQVILGPAGEAADSAAASTAGVNAAPVAEVSAIAGVSASMGAGTRPAKLASVGVGGAASSLVTTWKGLPRWVRRVSVLAGVVILVQLWRAGTGDERRPLEQPSSGVVAMAPSPRPQLAPQPAALAPAPTVNPSPDRPVKGAPNPVPPTSGQPTAPATAVQRPAVMTGDRWVTEVTDHQGARLNYRSERVVVSVDGGRLVTTAKTLKSNYTRTVEYDPDWGLLASRHPNGSETTFAPALPYMRFPIGPGSTWSARVEETSSSGERKVHNISARVTGWEDVRLPIGSFNTLRVELVDRIEVDGVLVHEGKDVSWYAPSVKRSVRSEEASFDPKTGQSRRRTIELVEYQVR